MSAADIVVRFLVGQFVSAFRRQLDKPDRWEADPKTRTIRRRGTRKKKPRQVVVETHDTGSKKDPLEGSTFSNPPIIDVCPWCGYIMPLHTEAGQCPKD